MSESINIYPELELKAVIDFLITEKVINSIDVNNGISTINTSSTLLLDCRDQIYLSSGMFVKLGNVNYQVSNVIKNTSFDVEATSLTAVNWALALEYRFGSKTEVNKLLVTASQKPENQLSRFPLLWLMIDSSNLRDYNYSPPINFNYSAKMAIISLTKKEYTAAQRLELNFRPVLKPYIDLILATLRSPYFSKVFTFEEKEITEYKEYFRYFYGSADKNKTVFEAVTDAIEIEMPLNFSNQYNCL
jgi:hypothetical protein